MRLGGVQGGGGDGADPDQGGSVFDAIACCRDGRGAGAAMGGEVGVCSGCPAAGDQAAAS